MATLSPTESRAAHVDRLVGSVCVPAGAGDYRALLATHHKIAAPVSRGTAYLSDPFQYANLDRQAADAAARRGRSSGPATGSSWPATPTS